MSRIPHAKYFITNHPFLLQYTGCALYIFFEGRLCSPVLRLRPMQPYVPLRNTTERKRPKEEYIQSTAVLKQKGRNYIRPAKISAIISQSAVLGISCFPV